ncbi:hypothetical protein [Oxobacter pfennigii]|uniref:hypothetical protein n=1 Tax=Oxobacter pfennigii TaxID=36849 RepID=UPI001364E1B8|nr:hypothetical protein [Oxobacter pfennigii]
MTCAVKDDILIKRHFCEARKEKLPAKTMLTEGERDDKIVNVAPLGAAASKER